MGSMTSEQYIFYGIVLIGSILVVSEWGKYGLCVIKTWRPWVGAAILIGCFYFAARSEPYFEGNYYATAASIVVTIVVFFRVRLSPLGRFHKASKRIQGWYPGHYCYGKILPQGDRFKGSSQAQETVKLLQMVIKRMPKGKSVHDKLEFALAHEWLGVLYRMMNEFEKAKREFGIDLTMLEDLNTEHSDNRFVRDALGHVLFRLAELDHILGRAKEALEGYKQSLNIDKSIGNKLRANITRELIRRASQEFESKNEGSSI